MRKMKDSGILWIGEIPEGWKVYELRRIGLFSASGIDKKIVEGEPLVRIINYTDVYGNKNYILCAKDYMTVSAPIEKIKEHQVEIGDVIFTPSSETVEDIGVSAVVMEELENTAYSYHVLRFRFFIDVCNAYKKYMFNNAYIQKYYSSRAVGSIRKTLSRDDFKGTKVCLPDFCEQQKIADFLDKKCSEIDKLIELQESMIEKLKEYKQSVITQAVTKGLDPDVPMKDSGIEWIGKIPEGWEVVRIKNCYKLRDEKSYEDISKVNLISLYTDLGVVQNKDIIYKTGNKAVSAEGYKKVYKDDIVVNIILCWMGAIGMSEYYGVTSPAYDVYSPLDGIYSKYYHYLFRTKEFNGQCYKYGRGIMMMRWRTYSSEFLAIPINKPPYIEQQQIADYLDKKCAEIDDLIKLKEQKIEKLKEYKKSLIYEYVTGKKEVC